MRLSNLYKPAFRWIAKRAIKYAGIPLRDPALVEMFGFKDTQAGVHVDTDTALGLSAYYSGVNLISQTIGMIEIRVARKDSNGSVTEIPRHFLNTALNLSANPYLSGHDFKAVMMERTIAHGDSYAKVYPVSGGVDLWPIPSEQIEPFYDEETGKKRYKYTARDESERRAAGFKEIYDDTEILQIPGYGYDGLCSRSVIECARENLGIGLATDRSAASFFGNSSIPGMMIKHPAELTPEAALSLESEIEAKLRGPMRTKRTMVFDEGMEPIFPTSPNKDAQFIENRQFQVREVARWLRIPPHMLYDLDSATWANVESLGIEFLVYTILPWVEKWIGALRLQFIPPEEWDSTVFVVDASKLLKMDTKSRYDGYNIAKNIGILSVNEIRDMEGRKPVPGGDTYTTPSTMSDLSQVSATDIQKTYELLLSIRGTTDNAKPLSIQFVLSMIEATLPTMEEKAAQNFVSQLQKSGIVESANNEAK